MSAFFLFFVTINAPTFPETMCVLAPRDTSWLQMIGAVLVSM